MTTAVVADLHAVRQARIVFLHHSVGQNVIDAVVRLDREVAGPSWPVLGIEDASAKEGGLLAHFSGGANLAPTTKVDAFVLTLLERPQLQADLALMKFCYVDFDPDTDVEALLAYYRDSIRALKSLRPGLRIGHVTTPLKAKPQGVGPAMRRMLGFQVWEDAANARREEYNRRLREEFASDPIFDLAAVESMGRSASSPLSHDNGTAALDPRLTDDGGHLNPTGARVVAVAWLHFLAEALRSPVRAVPLPPRNPVHRRTDRPATAQESDRPRPPSGL